MKDLEELKKVDFLNVHKTKNLIRPVHTQKLGYYKKVIRLNKELLGLNPDDPLPRDSITGELDVGALKARIKEKASDLSPITSELGLTDDAPLAGILSKIRELMAGSPASSEVIDKWSLIANSEKNLSSLGIPKKKYEKFNEVAVSAREVEELTGELVSEKFGELQKHLENAQYLNIGLGTALVGILVILIWKILHYKKLLSNQEEEKEEKVIKLAKG